MMFEEPSYLIQFGYNGQTIVKRAMKGGYADGVILSPTDYPKGKNEELATFVKRRDGKVLCDPQYYIPRTEREAAQTYPYFKTKGGDEFETVVVQREPEREELCKEILDVQDDLKVDAYIAPARHVDALVQRKLKEWEDLTQTFLEVADKHGRDIPVFASVPIDGDTIKHPDERNELLDFVTAVDSDGFYVSVEYDREQRYPLSGAQEVHSYLDFMKKLRVNRYEVIAGHSHQIAHLLFASGVNAFASGHYKNTKAFDIDRWVPDDEGFGRTVIYYYSDPVLNDIRVEQGLQNLYMNGFDMAKLRTDSPYEKDLFGATSPEGADWKLSEAAWDHYIWACYQISRKYRGKSIDERIDTAESHLKEAKSIYNDMLNYVEKEELETINPEIFDHWPAAFDSIKQSLQNPLTRRMLTRS